MTAQYTYVMKDLRKLVPPKREILKGIWLSFYPGAKIGVLGNNGAGLEKTLENFKGTVVAITHDRYFLDNVAKWILELDRGEGHPFEGNYSGWLELKAKRLKDEERQQDARSKMLARELEWVRLSPKARQAKSKARLNRYEEMMAEAQKEQRDDALEIAIPPGPRLGGEVVEFKNVYKSFGDRLLIEDLSFKLPRSGNVGVIGPNGAGKTTLFKMIMGVEKPDKGTIKIGDTVKLGYVDQSGDALDENKTIYDEISEGIDNIMIGARSVNTRSYVSSFNFKGQDQQKRVGILSGGERNREHLAKMIMRAGNLLLLDEPSNDLDVDTLRALEDGLDKFPGCAVVISHDRWFLDRIATHILAFEGDSHVEFFEGNFTDYEADRHRRRGTDADQPHRIKYKPLRA